jgi:hypothetical protein
LAVLRYRGAEDNARPTALILDDQAAEAEDLGRLSAGVQRRKRRDGHDRQKEQREPQPPALGLETRDSIMFSHR